MELSERIDRLEDKLNLEHSQNVERLVRIEAQNTHLDACLDSLNRKLFGNGQPGVFQLMDNRITNVEKWIWRVSGLMAAITVILNLALIVMKK